jgi:DHA2 family multidrug resistance protein
MARNLGGSVGLAIIGTLIDRRETFHTAVLREAVTNNSIVGQEHIVASAASYFAQTGDMTYAKLQALGQLAAQIQTQSIVITYSETFWVLGVALLVCIPLAFLLKNPRPGAAPVEAH